MLKTCKYSWSAHLRTMSGGCSLALINGCTLPCEGFSLKCCWQLQTCKGVLIGKEPLSSQQDSNLLVMQHSPGFITVLQSLRGLCLCRNSIWTFTWSCPGNSIWVCASRRSCLVPWIRVYCSILVPQIFLLLYFEVSLEPVIVGVILSWISSRPLLASGPHGYQGVGLKDERMYQLCRAANMDKLHICDIPLVDNLWEHAHSRVYWTVNVLPEHAYGQDVRMRDEVPVDVSGIVPCGWSVGKYLISRLWNVRDIWYHIWEVCRSFLYQDF